MAFLVVSTTLGWGNRPKGPVGGWNLEGLSLAEYGEPPTFFPVG